MKLLILQQLPDSAKTAADTVSFFHDWGITDYSALVAAIGGVIGLITLLGRFFNKDMRKTLVNIQVNTDKIPAMETDIAVIKTTLVHHDTRISRTERFIDDFTKAKLSGAASPLKLNEVGQKIFDNSKVKTIFKQELEWLTEKVKAREPKTAYQAQQILFEEGALFLDDHKEYQNDIEADAFEHGQKVSSILYVGALGYRDEILRALGFEISDIDKDAPAS